MKALMTMAAVGFMAVSTLAGGENCTKSKADCASKDKQVQVVNAAAKDGASCASQCKGEAQVVNAAAKDGASCASQCKGEAQVVNAAAKDGASCASQCKGKAQVVNAAAKDGASCASQCKGEALVVNAAAKDGASCASQCKGEAQVVNASATDGQCAAACAAKKEAMIAKAKAIGIPAMSFQVGDKATCCPMEAIEMWQKTNITPVATLNGKEYDCLQTAMTDWEAALTCKLNSMTQVSYVVNGTETQCSKNAGELAKSCNKPVLTRVANKEFTCQKSAQTTALKAVQAADAVPFKMTVAGTEYHCPMTAADASRLTGEKVIYNVNGAETCCKQTAMCLLLVNRIMATADAMDTVEVQTTADSGA